MKNGGVGTMGDVVSPGADDFKAKDRADTELGIIVVKEGDKARGVFRAPVGIVEPIGILGSKGHFKGGVVLLRGNGHRCEERTCKPLFIGWINFCCRKSCRKEKESK